MTLLAGASAVSLTIIMFLFLLVFVVLGIPIGFSMFFTVSIVGVLTLGKTAFSLIFSASFAQMSSYSMLAVPLFVFMGNMIQTTGIADMMLDSLNVYIGHKKGGLLVVVIIIGTVLAACIGVIAASVTLLTLVTLPKMMEKKYDKSLATGTICAAGSLGILIPPSVLLVMYGPLAGISVGQLFTSSFGIGFVLALFYIIYVVIRTIINPKLAPTSEKVVMPAKKKLGLLLKSFVPPALVILGVLGSIMFGIATPSEAAGVGALTTILLAVFYRKFTWKNFMSALKGTALNFGMIMMISMGAKCFTNLFIRLGCSNVIISMFLSLGNRWLIFFVIMVIVFILGMLIDWLGIILVLVPIVTPLAKELGFDTLWFAMMIIVNLQMSFITPPFAYAIFFLKGTADPQYQIEDKHIIKGVIPFVCIIVFTLVLSCFVPGLLTWLPSALI